MRSKSFLTDNSINQLIEMLLNKRCATRRISGLTLQRISKLEESGEQYCLNEKLFVRLIKESIKSESLQSILCAVVDIVKDECITAIVFEQLIQYADIDIRDNICISLSHKSLPQSMLIQLCEMNLTHECYYELIVQSYLCSDCNLANLQESIVRFKNSKFCSEEGFSFLLHELAGIEGSDKTKTSFVQSLIKERQIRS